MVVPRALGALAVFLLLVACPAGEEPDEPTPEAPTPEPPDCEDDEIIEAGRCVPPQCGVAPWGLLEPAENAIYVAPGGDGDGSEARPFGSVEGAVEAAADQGGGQVVLAAGEYAGPFVFEPGWNGVELVGRCKELVELSTATTDEWAVDMQASTMTLRSLSVRGGIGTLVRNGVGTLQGVDLLGAADAGLSVSGRSAMAILDDVLIADTVDSGLGIWLQNGGSLDADGLVIRDVSDFGILAPGAVSASSAGSAILRDVQITDIGTNSAGEGGLGLGAGESFDLTATDLLIERAARTGALITSGATAELVDVTIRETLGTEAAAGVGYGLRVSLGATVTATGLLSEQNQDGGVLVESEGSLLLMTDSTVRDTNASEAGVFGRGIIVLDRARLETSGVLVENNRDIGIFISGRASAQLDDTLVRGTRDTIDTTSGIGVAVQIGSGVFSNNLTVEDNDGPGIFVIESSAFDADDMIAQRNHFAGVVTKTSSFDISGGRISGTLPHPSEGGGVGIYTTRDAGRITQLGVRNVLFEGLRGPALYVLEIDDPGYQSYVLRRSTVRSTGGRPLPGGVFASRTRAYQSSPGGPLDGYGGLMIEGTAFEDIESDAILLDNGAAILQEQGGVHNSFTDVADEPLYVQRCPEEATEVLDDSGADPACRESARLLGPLLEYELRLREVDALGR